MVRALHPAAVALALGMAGAVSAQSIRVVDDLEQPFGGQWSARGGDVHRLAEAARTGTAGGRWDAHRGDRISRGAIPADWSRVAAFRISLRPGAGSGGAVVRTVRLVLEGAAGHGWKRRLRLPTDRWTDVEVPLWRFAHLGCPRWDELEVLHLIAEDDGPIDFDDLALVGGDGSLPDEVALELAFPDRPWVRRAVRRGPFRLLTDEPAADADAILTTFDETYRDFRQLFAVDEPPPAAPFDFYLFRDAETFAEGLPSIVRALYAARLPAPTVDGMSVLYLAASSHRAEHPAGRPVLFHEATHTFLAYHLRVPTEGGWLQEGAATWLQNRRHRQADLDHQVRQMTDEGNHLPLDRLFEARHLRPGGLYLQSMTVLEFLHDRGRLAAFAAGWRAGRETSDLIEEHLDVAGLDLDRAWLAFCRERYAE